MSFSATERRVVCVDSIVFVCDQCLATLFGVQQEVDRISSKHSRIQAVWKKSE